MIPSNRLQGIFIDKFFYSTKVKCKRGIVQETCAHWGTNYAYNALAHTFDVAQVIINSEPSHHGRDTLC